MKTLRLILLSAVLLPALLISYAKAQILITIDDSNPNAVTFTATGNAPGVSDSTHFYSQGLTFDNFYNTTAPINSGADLSVAGSSLATGVGGAGSPVYNSEQADGTGIQLYSYLVGSTETFSTGTGAFIGTTTFNLSTTSTLLPSFGTMGNLYAGSSALFSLPPVLIGQYKVVQATPEPSQYALMLLGTLGLIAFARFKGLTPVRGNLG